MILISSKYHITINRGADEHNQNKDIYEKLNADDKLFLASYLCMVSNLGAEVDKKLIH